jgi:hypothetical protein
MPVGGLAGLRRSGADRRRHDFDGQRRVNLGDKLDHYVNGIVLV